MPTLPPLTARSHFRRWLPALLVLMATTLMIRTSHLTAFPIFGDEAIYLRWAQLIRDGYPWISLADPKPPLHFWLLAALFNASNDPLIPARFLSVAAGVLSIPFVFLLSVEAAFLFRKPSPISGPALGFCAAILLLFSPFFHFYQRLATADALFAAESLALLWLSLLWARKRSWLTALSLGFTLGLALLTRQGLSYTLCAIPLLAYLLHRAQTPTQPPLDPLDSPSFSPRSPTLRTPVHHAMQLLSAFALALVLWSPYLGAELKVRALALEKETTPSAQTVDAKDLAAELKRRILYQDKFTDGGPSRLAVASRNTELTFWPTLTTSGQPQSGWLFYYLTPPIYVLVLISFPFLILRREWPLALLLFAWALLTLGPVILLGNVIYSRYILAGTLPLLLAAAYLLTHALAWTFSRLPGRAAIPVAALLLLGLLAQPFADLTRQSSRWWTTTLTARDRYQYVTGWTAGLATLRAADYLHRLADLGPIVVITGNEWGTPADALWVYLADHPNVSLYYTDKPQILTPGLNGGVLLRSAKWRFPPYAEVQLPKGVPIFYITQRIWGDREADAALAAHNPRLKLRETFQGLSAFYPSLGEKDGDVLLFTTPSR